MALPSHSGKTEYGYGGVAAADFRSNQVVHAHHSRYDSDILLAVGVVRDYATSGRATQSLSQEHLAGSGIQREEIAGDFTGEYQVAFGRRNTRYHWFRSVVAPFLGTG